MIVGLGNPGAEYERTRHNAGFMVIDRLINRHAPGAIARGKFHGAAVDGSIRTAAGEAKVMFLKPLTYMNRSGISVAEAARFYKVSIADDVLVVVDDVAIPLGTIRIRPGGGAGGHNGLGDIQAKLGTDQYARLRIGIGEPTPQPQRDYVLGRFTPEQMQTLEPALERAADAVAVWATEGVTTAMNRFNASDEPKRSRSADGGETSEKQNGDANSRADESNKEAS